MSKGKKEPDKVDLQQLIKASTEKLSALATTLGCDAPDSQEYQAAIRQHQSLEANLRELERTGKTRRAQQPQSAPSK